MSNTNEPVHVPSDNEEPKTPSTESSQQSTTRTPIPVASPTPTPPASFPDPATQPQPQPPSLSQPGPSRWRQHLQAKGAPHKRTARIRVRPPPIHVAEIQHFAWVRDTLDKWRSEEGLKSIMEATAPSPLSPVIPITREPIERTIPPLVVRTDSHDRTIREWQERHKQLDGHVRGWVEPKLVHTETTSMKNKQDVAIIQAKVDMVETENNHLREDVEELTDTIGDMEEYIDLLENRLVVIEDGYAHMQSVADTLSRVLNSLRQVQPPPPPPPQ